MLVSSTSVASCFNSSRLAGTIISPLIPPPWFKLRAVLQSRLCGRDMLAKIYIYTFPVYLAQLFLPRNNDLVLQFRYMEEYLMYAFRVFEGLSSANHPSTRI